MSGIKAENIVNGFFEAIKNEDVAEAYTYLSVSALNSVEKYNIALVDYMKYIKGRIIDINAERFHGYEERNNEVYSYIMSCKYSIQTTEQIYDGVIHVCSSDTENPDNVGIWYIEIYPKEYYDWFKNTNTSFDRLFLPGIYIYDEAVRPHPPAGQNSEGLMYKTIDFLETLKNRDVEKAATYLSVSAATSEEKDNKSIQELVNYTYGKITYCNYDKIDSHFDYTDTNWIYYETYRYYLHTYEETYTGYLDICAYDTKNPDNIGILYVDIACSGYYGNKPDYCYPELTGIFIYE